MSIIAIPGFCEMDEVEQLDALLNARRAEMNDLDRRTAAIEKQRRELRLSITRLEQAYTLAVLDAEEADADRCRTCAHVAPWHLVGCTEGNEDS